MFLLAVAIKGHKESMNWNTHLKVKNMLFQNVVIRNINCLSVSRVSIFLCLAPSSISNAPNLPFWILILFLFYIFGFIFVFDTSEVDFVMRELNVYYKQEIRKKKVQ